MAPLQTPVLGRHTGENIEEMEQTHEETKLQGIAISLVIGSSNLETLKTCHLHASSACSFFACCAIWWNNILLAQKL